MKETFERVYEVWIDFFTYVGAFTTEVFIVTTSLIWIIPYVIYKKMVERRKHLGQKEILRGADSGKVYFYARYGDNLPTHWMPLPQPPKEDE